MHLRHNEIKETKMMHCDTIFYQGMNTSQAQALKYTVDEKIIATTGEIMWCEGRNQLSRLKVIYNLFIGKEIKDVDLKPFKNICSFFNPVKLFGALATRWSNWRNGFHFQVPIVASPESVKFHAPILSKMSFGQETDHISHRIKYQSWLKKTDKRDGIILWGVSRGTAATFTSFAIEKYPEVKLVILEGAIDSIPNVMLNRISHSLNSTRMASSVMPFVNSCFRFFKRHSITSYNPDGLSPLDYVNTFPENIPVVFITSEIDREVPHKNTENIAMALARKGKNDVYRLILKHSSHPNYMFDNREDRDAYECFIHAIYKKYQFQHDELLAIKGEKIMQKSCLFDREKGTSASLHI
jgi:hypothetical protein